MNDSSPADTLGTRLFEIEQTTQPELPTEGGGGGNSNCNCNTNSNSAAGDF